VLRDRSSRVDYESIAEEIGANRFSMGFEVLDTARAVISGVVRSRLWVDIDDLKPFDAILDGVGHGVGAIATLNHDLLLEDAFRRRQMTFADGFGERYAPEVRFWTDDFPAATLPLPEAPRITQLASI
jgi:hypothetical protein